MENSYKGHDIEMMFTKIIGKLDRIRKAIGAIIRLDRSGAYKNGFKGARKLLASA